MNEKAKLRKKIHELDFALHELVLFADTHPTNKKALELMEKYRKMREDCIAEYESSFGKFFETANKTPLTDGCWKWLSNPWPWENDFMEG